MWLSSVGSKLEVGQKPGKLSVFNQIRPVEADCYRGYCLTSWIVERDGSPTSGKSDLGWCPGPVTADCRSDLSHVVWPLFSCIFGLSV